MFEDTITSLEKDVAKLEGELEGIEARRKDVRKKLRQARNILKKLSPPDATSNSDAQTPLALGPSQEE